MSQGRSILTSLQQAYSETCIIASMMSSTDGWPGRCGHTQEVLKVNIIYNTTEVFVIIVLGIVWVGDRRGWPLFSKHYFIESFVNFCKFLTFPNPFVGSPIILCFPCISLIFHVSFQSGW